MSSRIHKKVTAFDRGTAGLTRRGLVWMAIGALATGSLIPPAVAAPTADAAHALIKTVGERVLAILRADIPDADKFGELVALLDDAVDLNLISRLILGRHWRTATDDQRDEYQSLFRSYALDSLASKLHIYNGENFEITGAKVVDERDALVTTQIVSDRPPLHVDWRIRELKDGSLVAIDVIVESVSLIVTQRAEFASVVEREGIEGLLAQLRQRIDQLPDRQRT